MAKVNLDKAKRLVATAAKNVSPQVLERLEDVSELLRISGDPDVVKFIIKNDLHKPDNMIKFLVQLHFEELECVMDSFSESEKHDLNNYTAQITEAKYKIIHGLDNPDDTKQWLDSATDVLYNTLAVLYKKTKESYIQAIRDVDAKKRLQRVFYIRKVDANNYCAKEAVEAIMAAVSLQTAIAAKLGTNISDSVITPFNEFKSWMLSDDICKLMHNYDKESTDESSFWYELPERMENVLDAKEDLDDMMTSADENESDFDFDNIEFV